MRRQSDLSDIYGVKRIKSNPLEKDNDVPESGFRHSDSYHRYFRGYTEIRREKSNGRYSMERYYTQPWIVSAASGQVYWLTRLMYAALVILSWILYLWTMCADLGSNHSLLVAVPGLPSVIFLFLLSAVTISYIFVRQKMTLWEHESSTKRLKYFSLLTGGCIALTAICKLIYLLSCGGSVRSELISIGITLAAAACAAALFLLERKVIYTTIPHDTVLPEGETHEIW